MTCFSIHLVPRCFQQSGAEEACWAHNPEVGGSKPPSATYQILIPFTGTRWLYVRLVNAVTPTTDSSVGRAEDCSCDNKTGILRSLVQIRLGGLFSISTYCWIANDPFVGFTWKKLVRSGIRTHAHIRGPECSFVVKGRDVTLESGALDRSAILTCWVGPISLRHPVNVVNWMNKVVEDPGIDPGTSRMLSERSTIWASPPSLELFVIRIAITVERVQLWNLWMLGAKFAQLHTPHFTVRTFECCETFRCINTSARWGTRTRDPQIKSLMLYRLS